MKRLADLIIRNRVVVLIVVALATLFLGYEATKVKLNADFSSYLQQDNPLVQKFNRVGEIFAGKSITMVTIESEDIFSTKTLTLIRDLTNAYENLDGVSHVTSLTNIIDFRKTEWGLEVGKLIPRGEIPESPEELKKLKDYVMSREMYVGDLLSEDGKASIIVIRISAGADEVKVVKEIRKTTEEVAPSTGNIAFGGMPSLMNSMVLLISENMTVLLPIMVVLIFLVLIIAFRKPGGIFLPLIIVGLASVFTMGILVLLNLSLDLLTGIMPVILLAMGSADGIHFMKRYYEIRKTGKIPKVAVMETFAELWMPMVITTITTMVGFASLAISEFSVITQFGLITALAIFLALVITFTFLPAVLSFSRGRIKTPPQAVPKTNNRFLEKMGDFIYHNKTTILVSAAVIVIISAVAIPRIVKDVDWSLCLQKGSKPYRAEMLLREKFGGSLPIQVLVEGNIKDPATLKIMRYTERYLNSVPLVSESQSIAGIISEMNYVMNDRYVVPETREGVANLWVMIEGEDILEQMITADNKEALIQGKLATMATKPLVRAVNKIDRFIKKLPEDLAVLDLREILPGNREAFMAVRAKDITDKIDWDLQNKGLNVERSKIKELVDRALNQKPLNKKAYVELKGKIAEYLLSDESELEITSKSLAKAIAGRIVERLKKDGAVSRGQISKLIKSNIRGADKEDADYLAESLVALVSETLGETRVESALQALKEILPPGSGEIRDLDRDLKGDLWEMNENLIMMSLDEYRQISGGADPPQMRKLHISMDQTGLAPVLKHMEAVLTPSQLYSLLIALGFVIIMLALMLRSVVGGIISVAPISMTILFNFAVMGYAGIGLDSFTSMIASIAIGLGIDYAVHFNSRFRRELFNLKDEQPALKKTLGTTGVAIFINALTVGLGFSVLLLAGGQHIRRFGGLTALTMLTSAVFTLMVLPALTLAVKPKYLTKQTSGAKETAPNE